MAAALPFVLVKRHRFFNFYCLFRQQFSSAYLLKLCLLAQRVHTTLFIRCDKPELTCWFLCSLHAGMQMSPDELVGSRDCCRHSIAEGTVDVPIRLFQQSISSRNALFLCPFAESAVTSDCRLIQLRKLFGYRNGPCNCHHFSPFMSPRDARVVQMLS